MSKFDDGWPPQGMHHSTGRARFVVARPDPVTYEDLVRAFTAIYPPDMAAELIADLPPDIQDRGLGPWSQDILLAVAGLSDEHTEKIRKYLGWSREHMASELARSRKEP